MRGRGRQGRRKTFLNEMNRGRRGKGKDKESNVGKNRGRDEVDLGRDSGTLAALRHQFIEA